MFRTSQPHPYKTSEYEIHINDKADPPEVYITRFAMRERWVKLPHGYEPDHQFVGRRLDPLPLSDFLANPFDFLPVEHDFQRCEIIEWLRKEGYEPYTV